MGKTKRHFNKMFIDYKKSQKKAFLSILEIMPNGYTDELYVNSFKKYYLDLFEDIEKEYLYWKKRNDKILDIGKKSRYDFPDPFNFIVSASYQSRKARESRRELLNNLDLNDRMDQLTIQMNERISNRDKKLEKKLELVQEAIFPKHIQTYINKYSTLKGRTQETFTEKLFIIKEISKYKNSKTINFLSKINALEVNFTLKLEAVYTLQHFGEKVILRRKSKGKLKQISTIAPDLKETPSFLKYMIENEQLEQHKQYDIFLSHSSFDREEIVDFSKILNTNNFHTYVDWINDLHYLKRDLVGDDTTDILLDRLKKSKILIYYHTENSLNSYWTPWEIGYFIGLNKTVYVYNPYKLELPIYLTKHQTLELNSNLIYIKEKGEKLSL